MTIHVPELMDRKRIVVPRFILGDVEYRTDSRGRAFSAQEYHADMSLPTLAELRHAFETSPMYRESVQESRGKGEWTANFLGPREPSAGEAVPEGYTPAWFYTPIDESERVFRDPQSGLWIAECDSKHKVPVLLPPEDLVLEYDKPTGLPSRTGSKKDAEKVFGDDTSHFYANRNGLRAVLRGFNRYFSGPFSVSALYVPDDGRSYFGGRVCSRSEQDAKHLATPAEKTE